MKTTLQTLLCNWSINFFPKIKSNGEVLHSKFRNIYNVILIGPGYSTAGGVLSLVVDKNCFANRLSVSTVWLFSWLGMSHHLVQEPLDRAAEFFNSLFVGPRYFRILPLPLLHYQIKADSTCLSPTWYQQACEELWAGCRVTNSGGGGGGALRPRQGANVGTLHHPSSSSGARGASLGPS